MMYLGGYRHILQWAKNQLKIIILLANAMVETQNVASDTRDPRFEPNHFLFTFC